MPLDMANGMVAKRSIENLDPSDTMTEQKALLRRQAKQDRESFVQKARTAQTLNSIQSQVIRNLQTCLAHIGVRGNWASYRSYRAEVGSRCEVDGIRWAYPRIVGRDLEFYTFSGEEVWGINSYGIEEPDFIEADHIPVEELAGFIVPGVVFDRFGGRVGHGQGFYDRCFHKTQKEILKKLNNPSLWDQIPKIGLAYSVQVLDQALPMEEHDIAMDIIVTEREVIHCSQKKFFQKGNE